jgi:hypothetical protein
MTKQEEYNFIKRIINDPENKVIHLEAIELMVDLFNKKYPCSNLGNLLKGYLREKLELLK